MAYPTGSGSEVLKRTSIHAQSNTATAFRWDGTMATAGTSTYTVTANHILTILNIIFTEAAGADEQIHMYVVNGDDSQEIKLISYQSIPDNGTFVWNEKLVLKGGDKLVVNAQDSSNIDCLCSYIDQDWS